MKTHEHSYDVQYLDCGFGNLMPTKDILMGHDVAIVSPIVLLRNDKHATRSSHNPFLATTNIHTSSLTHTGKRRMFSGYIPVEGEGRELFYWLVESDKGFANAPVMLWTNGGPGCSGLLGFLTEQGPFRPNKQGHLDENKFAWTKLASIVFIEQPVGVGFSKPGRGETYGDAKAAVDNYRFVVNFFNRYPDLRSNEFYISSESYGGHYMPTLARELVDRGGVPNFRGFMVGNPLTSGPLRDYGEFMTLHGHQLIPKLLFDEFHKNSCKEKINTEVCQHLQNEARTIVAGLDPYGLDFPVCSVRAEKIMLLKKLGLIKEPSAEHLEAVKVEANNDEELANPNEDEDDLHVAGKADSEQLVIAQRRVQRRRSLQYFPDKYQPCEESFTTSWLNRPDVRRSLHVREGASAWAPCNNYINIVYNQTDVVASMVPLYEYLATKNLKIWVYSGDDDTVCATASDQEWIWNFPASSRWNAWHVSGQVAGFIVHFKGFTYATVHGAGHMVPSTRPKSAFELLKKFLKA